MLKQAGAAAVASGTAFMSSTTGPESPGQELSPEALWQRIEAAYSRAEASGAAYRRGLDSELAGTAALLLEQCQAPSGKPSHITVHIGTWCQGGAL